MKCIVKKYVKIRENYSLVIINTLYLYFIEKRNRDYRIFVYIFIMISNWKK